VIIEIPWGSDRVYPRYGRGDRRRRLRELEKAVQQLLRDWFELIALSVGAIGSVPPAMGRRPFSAIWNMPISAGRAEPVT